MILSCLLTSLPGLLQGQQGGGIVDKLRTAIGFGPGDSIVTDKVPAQAEWGCSPVIQCTCDAQSARRSSTALLGVAQHDIMRIAVAACHCVALGLAAGCRRPSGVGGSDWHWAHIWAPGVLQAPGSDALTQL